MGGVSVHKAKEGLNKAAALGIAQLAGDRWQLSKLSSGGGMLSFFGQNLEPIIDTHAQPVDKTVDNSDETVDNFPENGETEEKKFFFPININKSINRSLNTDLLITTDPPEKNFFTETPIEDDEFKELYQALLLAGVRQPVLDELAARPYLTAKHVTNWEIILKKKKGNKYSTGYLIAILRGVLQTDPPPSTGGTADTSEYESWNNEDD